MTENFEAEQNIVNAHIDQINALSGHVNTSYAIQGKYPSGDHAQVVIAKGSDNKSYQIEVSSTAPFIKGAHQMILLD